MKFGFTLAEVLVTLGIVGVVASMTLPTLNNNVQKQTYEAGAKKAYNIVSNAVSMYMVDQGTDDLTETCGLICYTISGDDKITVIFSEFLSIYNSILNLGDVARALRKLADEVEIKDKNLIKLFNREEIKLYPVSGEKGLYTL